MYIDFINGVFHVNPITQGCAVVYSANGISGIRQSLKPYKEIMILS